MANSYPFVRFESLIEGLGHDQLYNVEFLEDFGIFSKGEVVELLVIQFDGRPITVFEITRNGQAARIQHCKLAPM